MTNTIRGSHFRHRQPLAYRLLWNGLLATVSLPSGGCNQAHAAPPIAVSQAPAVRLAPVNHRSFAPLVRAVGVLAGKQESKLSFKNGGTVEKLLVEAGQRVRGGQVLATLNQTEISSQVTQAKANLEKATREARRAHELANSGTDSPVEVENADTSLQLARAALQIAVYNAKVSTLVAPEAGTVQERLVEAGEQVASDQPIYQLRSERRGWVVRAGLPDRVAVAVQLGAAAEVTFDAFPAQTFKGELTELATAASPHTGTYAAEIRVVPEEAHFLSGLIARVTLERARPQTLDVIPIEALVEGSGNHGAVFTVDKQGQALRQPIEIAFIEGEQVAVSQGLAGVPSVVSEGAAFLSAGVRVHPLQ